MSMALEILMAPFFAVVDFVLAAPTSAVVAVCVVGVVVAMLVAVA